MAESKCGDPGGSPLNVTAQRGNVKGYSPIKPS